MQWVSSVKTEEDNYSWKNRYGIHVLWFKISSIFIYLFFFKTSKFEETFYNWTKALPTKIFVTFLTSLNVSFLQIDLTIYYYYYVCHWSPKRMHDHTLKWLSFCTTENFEWWRTLNEQFLYETKHQCIYLHVFTIYIFTKW